MTILKEDISSISSVWLSHKASPLISSILYLRGVVGVTLMADVLVSKSAFVSFVGRGYGNNQELRILIVSLSVRWRRRRPCLEAGERCDSSANVVFQELYADLVVGKELIEAEVLQELDTSI